MRRFEHRWARSLHCTRRELLQRVNSADISEAMAYERIDPLPDPWLMVGTICSVMANLWCGKKGKKYKPHDFMPVKPQSEARTLFGKLKAAFVNAAASQKRNVS